MGGCHSMSENEQLVLRDRNGKKSVLNGPTGCTCTGAKTVQEKRTAVVVSELEYAKISDTVTGHKRLVNGQQIVWMEPHEQLISKEKMIVLGVRQFAIIKNTETGEQRSVYGPTALKFNSVYEEIEGTIGTCPVLEQGSFCRIRDTRNGQVVVVCGPKIIKLHPLEVMEGDICKLPILQHGEYCLLRDEKTGRIRIVTGPKIAELGPHDSISKNVTKFPALQRGEYCRIQDEEEGNVRVAYGPAVVKLGPYEDLLEGIKKCPDLAGDEYLVVRNESEGTKRNIVGPTLYMPDAFDQFDQPQKVITLKRTQYVKISNYKGVVRVERGPQRVIPDPIDTVLDGGKKEAVFIDKHCAVLVRNTDNGSLQLVTDHGLYFPTPYQVIEKVQQKIVLKKYETMVCKDATGRFYFASGDMTLSEEERGPGPDFFLPPHHEIVTASWSTDLRKEHATSQEVSRFDSRPAFMNYEFECRTIDNVPLVMDVTFFWRIIDVKAMIERTADAPGDACIHARSMIMGEISKIKLMDFLLSYNEVLRNACMKDNFYTERGVELLDAEVLKLKCASVDTNAVLQDIIRETCDRLKFKERQKGENEVSLERLGGEIEEEKLKQVLVEVKKSHLKVEAKIEGEAEGMHIAEFLGRIARSETTDGKTLGVGNAMKVFETIRSHRSQIESTRALASGRANVTIVPDDVVLKLGNHSQ